MPKTLTEATGALKEARDAVIAQRRELRWVIGIGLVCIVLFSSALWRFYELDENRQQDQCEQDQRRREDIFASFAFLADTLIGPNPSPEIQARRDGFLDELAVRFPIGEC